MPDTNEQLAAVAAKLGIGSYTRHVLLCTGPNCCTPEEGQAAWDALKREIKEHDLGAGPRACYRTKVGCLRICVHGPTAVVYPEGTWYHGLSAERAPRFVQQHLVEGRPVEEWVFARNPLSDEADLPADQP
jgi:(2Fe-2S) ferredoxin